MAKNAMPKSKAKTAYGLLSEIRALILKEPKRYDQRDYLKTGDEAIGYYGNNAPTCGTVGCVAGWVGALKGGFKKFSLDDGSYIDDFATDVLFGQHANASELSDQLFDGEAAGPRNNENPVAHAQRGAKHIAKFQKKYAKQLKAKRV
jgi:hypothetical protein